MSKVQEYGKLARIHSAALTGLAPVLGALAAGMIELKPLIILFGIGLCTHIFGFTFNEYMDIDIDSKSRLLKNKPLVKGIISKSEAIAFAVSGVILGYILTSFLILMQHSMALLVLLLYTISWLAIGVYDLTSKQIRGSDFALAIWTGTLCLLGGFALTTSPNKLVFIIAGLAFFQLMVQNILAGLKDIPQDKIGLGTSTPLRMGVKQTRKQIHIPYKFQSYIYGLKILHLAVVFIPFIFLWLEFITMQLGIILFLLIFNFLLVFYIFNSHSYSRDTLLRIIGLHEIISYSIVPIMLYGIIDLITIIFILIFPIIWLAVAMKLLYSRLLPDI